MESDDQIVLRLEIEPGSDPIRGKLRLTSGTARPFGGWVGLAAAIDWAIRGERREAANGRRPPDV